MSIFQGSSSVNELSSRGVEHKQREVSHDNRRIFTNDYRQPFSFRIHMDLSNPCGHVFGAQTVSSLSGIF